MAGFLPISILNEGDAEDFGKTASGLLDGFKSKVDDGNRELQRLAGHAQQAAAAAIPRVELPDLASLTPWAQQAPAAPQQAASEPTEPPSGMVPLPSLETFTSAWEPEKAPVPVVEDAIGPGSSSPGAQTAGAGFSSPQAPAVAGDDVSQAALAAGVDPTLFSRLVGQESGGDQGAVSPMGALGAAQLMPSTAAYLAKKYNLDTSTRLGNLTAGAYYLKEQLDQFGSVPLALAAYNAGPGAVQKHGGVPPFAETQKYVQIVGGGYAGDGRAQASPPPAGSAGEAILNAGRAVGGAIQSAGEAVGNVVRGAGQALSGLVDAYEGTPYVFGGAGGRSAGLGAPTDCSGFVSAWAKSQGVDLPAHTDAAYNQILGGTGRQVSSSEARPGDIVFYMGAGTGGAVTHHMGIYAGPGKVLDMSVAGGGGVQERPIGHAGQYVILRDERLSGGERDPNELAEAPPIVASGVAEQTGGDPEAAQRLGVNPFVIPDKGAGLSGTQAYDPDERAARSGPQPGDFPETPPAEVTQYPTPAKPEPQGLDALSNNLTSGLNNAASGLTSLLNQGADAITGAVQPIVSETQRRFDEQGQKTGRTKTWNDYLETIGVIRADSVQRAAQAFAEAQARGEPTESLFDRLKLAIQSGVMQDAAGRALQPAEQLAVKLMADSEDAIVQAADAVLQAMGVDRTAATSGTPNPLATGSIAGVPVPGLRGIGELAGVGPEDRLGLADTLHVAAKLNPLHAVSQAGQFIEKPVETAGLVAGGYYGPKAVGAGARAAGRALGSLEPVRRAGDFLGGIRDASQELLQGRTGGAPVARVVPESVARRIPNEVQLPDDPMFREAIINDGGGEFTADGLRLNLLRHQKPAQEGASANRGGVFYEAKPPGAADAEYAQLAGEADSVVGGTQRIEGPTLIRRPLVTRNLESPLDTLAPELDQQRIAREALDIYRAYRGGRTSPEPLAALLQRYGGNPADAADILQHQDWGEASKAVLENIAATRARAAGYDSIIAVSDQFNDGKPWVSEVLDLRENRYPAPEGGYSLRPEFAPDPTLAAEADRLSGGRQAGRAPGLGVVAQESDRYYHGTGTGFDTPSGDRFDPNGLFGPAYYLTTSPTVGASYADVRARGPRPASRTEDDAFQALQAASDDLMDRPGDPAAQAAYERARADHDAAMQAGQVSPDAAPNMRAVDVPKGLRLLDAEGRPSATDLVKIVDAANELTGYGIGSAKAAVSQIARDLNAGRPVYDALRQTIGDTNLVNESLAAAGWDGVRYDGGKRIPMLDSDGKPITHDAVGVFAESLGKLRNATSGQPGGLLPSAAPIAGRLAGQAAGGAVAGGYAASQEEGATPESIAKGALLGAAQRVVMSKIGGADRQFAQGIARSVVQQSNQQGPTAMDWVKSLGYNAMIGPTTGIVNAVGGAFDLAWHLPKSAAVSVARGEPEAFVAEMKGMLSSPMRAGAAALDAIMHGSTNPQVAQYQTLSEKLNSPVWKAVAQGLEFGGRVFSQSPDAFWGEIARSMGAGKEAARIATSEGLKPNTPAWAARHQALLQDATAVRNGQLAQSPYAAQQINDAATDLMNRLTFKGEMGEIGKSVQDLLNRKGPGGVFEPFSHLAMPFWPTLYHMGARLAEKTPGGFLADQPKAERVYDTVMGGLMFAGLTGLAIGGEITGSGPSDPQQKQMLRDQGWRPNSTRIGPYYVPNRLLGSFGPMFNAAGEVGDNLRYGKDETDPYKVTLGAVKRFGSVVGDQVYFKGLGDILNAMKDPERFLQGYATSTASRGLPYASTLRTIATATDPTERRAERAKDIGLPAAIGQGIQAGIPGLRQNVPPVQDVLGRPVENRRTGPMALLPAYGVDTPDPTLSAFVDAGIDISTPPKSFTLDGIEIPLSPSEQRRFQAIRGDFLQRFVPKVIERPAWAAWKPETRAKALQTILDDMNRETGVQLRKELGPAEIRRRLTESRQKKAS